MADNLNDGEFWLPSQFLDDDDVVPKKDFFASGGEAVFGFPYEFPYDYGSYGRTSLNYEVDPAETESDDEEKLTGLCNEMASIAIQDENKISHHFVSSNNKLTASGSPMSTLSATGSWWAGSTESSRGSSKEASQGSSPHSSQTSQTERAWDVICAAAQIVRIKSNVQEPPKFRESPLLRVPHGTSSFSSPAVKVQGTGFYPDSRDQFLMKSARGKMMNPSSLDAWVNHKPSISSIPSQTQSQMLQNKSNTLISGTSEYGYRLSVSSSASSAWPPLTVRHNPSQQSGSVMRAVFLGGSGAKKECTGTGVFLPRTAGNPAEFSKRSVCSTALVPDRVAQALNLNFDYMGSHSRDQVNNINHYHDRTSSYLPHQTPNLHRSPASSYECRLPSEWTY